VFTTGRFFPVKEIEVDKVGQLTILLDVFGKVELGDVGEPILGWVTAACVVGVNRIFVLLKDGTEVVVEVSVDFVAPVRVADCEGHEDLSESLKSGGAASSIRRTG
jgi:hypothetical protein